MPNGQCGPQRMQMQRCSLTTNRVRDEHVHKKSVSQSLEAKFSAENAPCTKIHLASGFTGGLGALPRPLAGFRGRGTPQKRLGRGRKEVEGIEGKVKGEKRDKGR